MVVPRVGSASGVDNHLAQQFAVGGVDDADAQVLCEQDEVGSDVGSSGADVLKFPRNARSDDAPC